MTILLTVVLGSNLFMATAVARDRGKIGFGRHTKYYGSAIHHGKFWRGVGYHAYDPHCHTGEDSKYPPWSFCLFKLIAPRRPQRRLALTAKQGSSKLSRSSVASGPRQPDQRAGV